METKKFELTNGWSLLAHPSCKVFVDVEDQNRYSVVDEDNDVLVMFVIKSNSYKFESTGYRSLHETDFLAKTITILNEPEED